jgi:outer membrane lipoprotein-sorting protein
MRSGGDSVEPRRVPCQTASVDLGRGRNASALSQSEPLILEPVDAPPILQRHPALRWLAPVGVAGIVALAATGVFTARATTDSLPKTTPAALIAAVQHSDVSGFSGTVVSHLSLGLPELPSVGNAGDGTSFTSLLSGSHTLQVWYGGEDRQRIALLGSTEESDVFRDGRQLWQWSSADAVAVHTVLPADPREAAEPTTDPTSVTTLTPLQVARQALGAMDPTTGVRIAGHHSVADRAAYDLVLTPRTAGTKVGSVRIAVDGSTKVPLGVQVYARNATTPSLDVAFTSIVFGSQAERNFQFSPPPGATVHQTGLERPASSGDSAARPAVVSGSGWTRVVELRPGAKAIGGLNRNAALKSLTPVSGSWGTGRLLDSDLLSALITDDGRVFAGAVEPADLFAAAGRK